MVLQNLSFVNPVAYVFEILSARKGKSVLPPWFNTEQKTLRALYSIASWDEIERAVPRHTRGQIASHAARLRLRRPPILNRGPAKDPLIRHLIDVADADNVSISEFARRVGAERATLYHLINGRSPNLKTLRNLADALGLELVLVPKNKCEDA